jgi:phosphate acetyltransferase
MNEQMLTKWVDRVKGHPQRVAFPEATEERILQAARQAQDTGAIKSVLVGNGTEISAAAKKFKVNVGDMVIIDNTDPDAVQKDAEAYVVTNPVLPATSIKRKCRDPLYYAFVLQMNDKADAVFAGLTHTTGDVLMAAQMIVGLAPNISTPSSIGIMDIPGYKGENGTLLAFSDSAVCAAPTPEELADIAISSCETVASLLEWEPKCALLSFSTCGSGEGEKVEKVVEAVRIAREKRPDLAIDGEFQLDAAVSPAVAQKKVKRESKVAGHANIIIYPDLNAGNIGVKIAQQFAKCDAYGPMLQGFARPVSDCSRGAPVSELVGNIVMLAVRAMNSGLR